MTSKVKDYINVFIILSFAWIIALGGGYESLSYNGYPILILCMITSFLVHWIIFIPSFLAKTEKFGADILKLCVKFGGVLSGEHGIGVEKRELMCEMFNNNDIQQQISIKNSLDPSSLLNPGKVYPILRKCAEEGRLHIHGRDKSKFSDIPRF